MDIVDLRTKNTAHSPWVHSTQGLQLLPTPEGSMLLVLDRTEAGWTLEALSLDEAADPPLFKVVKKRHLLPRLASLPKVGMCLNLLLAVCFHTTSCCNAAAKSLHCSALHGTQDHMQ